MTKEDRTARITELRAEADRLEMERKRNWPEKVEAGMLFQEPTSTWITDDRDGLIKIIGEHVGMRWLGWSPDLMPSAKFIGHASDLLTICLPPEKTSDAPEPTGADLVGKVCQLSLCPINTNSDGITDTVVMYDAHRDEYHGDGGQGKPWKYARLYRGDRP